MSRSFTLVAGILALALVFVVCLVRDVPRIERDLAVRSQSLLNASNFGWARVRVDGRDVYLMGQAPVEGMKVLAGKLAGRPDGVRTVHNQLTVGIDSHAPTTLDVGDANAGPAAGEPCVESIRQLLADQDLTFIGAGTHLTSEMMSFLRRFARAMRACPVARARIEGHADSMGGAARNFELSEARALAVHEYLVGIGVAESQISTMALGDSHPIAINETQDGRARNRRVEIVLVEP